MPKQVEVGLWEIDQMVASALDHRAYITRMGGTALRCACGQVFPNDEEWLRHMLVKALRLAKVKVNLGD